MALLWSQNQEGVERGGGGEDEEGECALCLQILNFMPQSTKKFLGKVPNFNPHI